MTADQLTDAGIVFTASGFVVFSFLYGVLAPWWHSALGRNVMALMASCGGFVSLGVIRVFSPHAFDAAPWIRPTVWLIIGSIAWWRVVLLIHEQVRGRRPKRTLHPESPAPGADPQEGT